MSAEKTDKFDCEVPRVIKNRAWYIYTVAPVPPDEQSVTMIDEAPLYQAHRRLSPCRQPQRAVFCLWY